MLRSDLEAAGIPYEDESERKADFHSLRHTFVTLLKDRNVHPKTAQTLARHSAIGLTMDTYTHSHAADEVAAIEALPDFGEVGITEMATGTDGNAPSQMQPRNSADSWRIQAHFGVTP